MASLQSLIYTPGSNGGGGIPRLRVLDQLLLPHDKVYLEVKTIEDAWQVIRRMNVRGAPLIGIVAALGVVVDLLQHKGSFSTVKDLLAFIKKGAEHLKTSRPTAVNLFLAMDDMWAAAEQEAGKAGATVEQVMSRVIGVAETLYAEDVKTNQTMGEYGAAAILANQAGHVRVLTHCNTGSLATAGYGTALGVIRAIHAKGRLERVYATETRPYNQGARLTSFEIVEDGLPGTLITDSMASFLMSTTPIHAVVVGADRIAANGDTANKIGTYQLAVAAKYHKVPFYIAAPFTTCDLTLPSGRQIPIEQRPAKELTSVQGVQVAAEGIEVWNPGFDVTPASLISGIITEKGVIRPRERVNADGTKEVAFDVAAFFKQNEQTPSRCQNATDGYYIMDTDKIAAYLRDHVGHVWARLGAQSVQDLDIAEVGDGNLNLVFIIKGPTGSVVVKQALPYLRCVGESWPLTIERIYFEHAALLEEARFTPTLVPEVFHFSKDLALVAMTYIEPPHLILRKALIRGDTLSTVAHDMAKFMAHNLFYTSSLHLQGPEKRTKVSFWSKNTALCALTEAVIFTEPYFDVAHNRWTSPQLDQEVQAIRNDLELKQAIGKLKAKFVDNTEALLHGDLHTGSVMVKDGSTIVIDPEFAFYGPMGFDVGALLANFFLSFFSQAGHSNGPAYARWVLDQAVAIWETFAHNFVSIWNDPKAQCGELYTRSMFISKEDLTACQEKYMRELFWDSLGFAGAKMIRRIVGIAHVEDMDSITNADVRASCERKALWAARELIVNAQKFSTIREVASMVLEGAQQ